MFPSRETSIGPATKVRRKSGTDIRTVQEFLGRQSVETTQIYTHVMQKPGLGVRSPLD